ncbi:FosX/FosE/FosI family fosfomycin resistance hydrolase [Terrilactibacillus laevilacticus]|uniref:FosX/FosE/FosI family fosfomycin resistance hydrolase n=1 Tax=Terrilactibacillus laevilacticus TaxID=1380157 RepID=A0ABW5PRP9_9BACI|nr:FosX/FosE/FosI family fosfomycin resistance hydrolase [Terrilactibacillus laevilacticus]
MIEGISHITFIVKDLEKSTRFFKYVFDAKCIYSSGNITHSLSREKFFLIGGVWIAIMEGEPLTKQTYNHVAFKINDQDFEEYYQRITELQLEYRTPRSRIEGEGRSLYFYDYDNHLFELHTGTLQERLEKYASIQKEE